MKALSVIGSIGARNGGPGISLVRSVPELRRFGVELDIATTDMATPSAFGGFRRMSAHDMPEGASYAQISISRSRWPHRFNFAPSFRSVMNTLVPERDVVRIHGMYLYPHLMAYQAARAYGVPYFVSPHGILDPYIRRRSHTVKRCVDAAWQARIMRDAQFVHATTEDEARDIRIAFPGVRTAVVPNGIDVERFSTMHDGAAFRARHLGDWQGGIVTFLGRLSHKKGIDILIKAMGRLDVPQRPLLVIVGPDDENLAPALQRVADMAGMSSHTVFTGALYGEEQLQALAATDVWVLPSRGENFGNAVVEAMAAGCPVVVSPEVGLARAIRLARAGVIADANPVALGAALSRLLADASERKRLSTRGAEFAAQFGWDVVASQLAELFDSAKSGASRVA